MKWLCAIVPLLAILLVACSLAANNDGARLATRLRSDNVSGDQALAIRDRYAECVSRAVLKELASGHKFRGIEFFEYLAGRTDPEIEALAILLEPIVEERNERRKLLRKQYTESQIYGMTDCILEEFSVSS